MKLAIMLQNLRQNLENIRSAGQNRVFNEIITSSQVVTSFTARFQLELRNIANYYNGNSIKYNISKKVYGNLAVNDFFIALAKVKNLDYDRKIFSEAPFFKEFFPLFFNMDDAINFFACYIKSKQSNTYDSLVCFINEYNTKQTARSNFLELFTLQNASSVITTALDTAMTQTNICELDKALNEYKKNIAKITKDLQEETKKSTVIFINDILTQFIGTDFPSVKLLVERDSILNAINSLKAEYRSCELEIQSADSVSDRERAAAENYNDFSLSAFRTTQQVIDDAVESMRKCLVSIEKNEEKLKTLEIPKEYLIDNISTEYRQAKKIYEVAQAMKNKKDLREEHYGLFDEFISNYGKKISGSVEKYFHEKNEEVSKKLMDLCNKETNKLFSSIKKIFTISNICFEEVKGTAPPMEYMELPQMVNVPDTIDFQRNHTNTLIEEQNQETLPLSSESIVLRIETTETSTSEPQYEIKEIIPAVVMPVVLSSNEKLLHGAMFGDSTEEKSKKKHEVSYETALDELVIPKHELDETANQKTAVQL